MAEPIEMRYVSPGTSGEEDTQDAVVAPLPVVPVVIVPRRIGVVPATRTLNDDALTPVTASENVTVSGPVTDAPAGGPVAVGATVSMFQSCVCAVCCPEAFVTVTRKVCGPSGSPEKLNGVSMGQSERDCAKPSIEQKVLSASPTG